MRTILEAVISGLHRWAGGVFPVEKTRTADPDTARVRFTAGTTWLLGRWMYVHSQMAAFQEAMIKHSSPMATETGPRSDNEIRGEALRSPDHSLPSESSCALARHRA